MPGGGDHDGGDDLERRWRPGATDGDDRGGEAADRGEQGVEREVVQLDGEQHDAGSDPGDGHASTFFLMPNSTAARRRTVREHGDHNVGLYGT